MCISLSESLLIILIIAEDADVVRDESLKVGSAGLLISGAHTGSIKSAIGIGALLSEGIGDTIRVSLTADPVLEVKEGRAILSALDLLEEKQIDIVSCPTCGRTKIDLIPLLSEFEAELDRHSLRSVPIKVAFMGCIVNGPGEAREADIGVAGGDGIGVIFRRGVPMEKVKMDEIVPTLIKEICIMKEKNHD